MARYLAGRERTVAEIRPDLAGGMAPAPQLQRRTFGRKAAGR
jgi:hypothetical protein